MIKVNLLRNMGLDVAGSGGAGATPVSANVQRDAVMKLAVIMLLPVLLILYEKINISSLDEQLVEVQNKISAADAERATFGDQGPRVEKYTVRKKKMDRELETIRAFSKNRLQDVKAIDAIQSLIPSQTWLRRITVNGTSVRIEGYTIAEEGVSDLIRVITESPFFSNVEPKSTSQEELPTGPAKRFEIEFKVGK